jgi:hypothetical protein
LILTARFDLGGRVTGELPLAGKATCSQETTPLMFHYVRSGLVFAFTYGSYWPNFLKGDHMKGRVEERTTLNLIKERRLSAEKKTLIGKKERSCDA